MYTVMWLNLSPKYKIKKESDKVKCYEKPNINIETFINHNAISSLDDWLDNNNLLGAGITTYVINS